MSTNTELQNLLTKMGGTPTEEDSNSDLIKKIATAYEGGGSGGTSSKGGNVLVLHPVNEKTGLTSEKLVDIFGETYGRREDVVSTLGFYQELDCTLNDVIESFHNGIVVAIIGSKLCVFDTCNNGGGNWPTMLKSDYYNDQYPMIYSLDLNKKAYFIYASDLD